MKEIAIIFDTLIKLGYSEGELEKLEINDGIILLKELKQSANMLIELKS